MTKDDIDDKTLNIETDGKGLSSADAKSLLEKYGPNKLEEKKESNFKKIIKPFWSPIPWMIEIAAILSACIQHWEDFIVISFLLIINAAIEYIQGNKAANALEELKKSMALQARTKRDGKWINISASELVPGDVVNVKNGDIVPADCLLISGSYLSIDQSALTGESLPANKVTGDVVYASSIVKQGDMDCVITETGGNTFFGKTSKLVQNAKTKSHFEESVLKVGKFLIYGALILAVMIFAKEIYADVGIAVTLQLVLVLIIASIPVAMPAVLSVTMALGALTLSKKRAIVTSLQSIVEMAGVNILCTDKTGTLTQNKLTLGEPTLYQVQNEDELFLYSALACKEGGDDAIDNTIIAKVDSSILNEYTQTAFIPFDPISKKTEAEVDGQDGSFKVIKGAPQVVIDMCRMSSEESKKVLQEVNAYAKRGLRALGVAKTNSTGNYELLGILSLFDPPWEDSKEVISQANAYNIKVRMVTGDDLAIGKEISHTLGMGEHLKTADEVFHGADDMDLLPPATVKEIVNSDGYARVYPEHKYGIVKALQTSGNIVAMTGDGVNDAPALKQADVGVAVSGATDAARAAADIILTAPGLSVIITAVEESRKIFKRMVNYINYRVAMTINIMVFVTLSVLFSNTVPLTAIMIIMLALLDDIPIMAIAYDNTEIAPNPITWKMGKILSLSTVVGMASVVESFVLMGWVTQYTNQSFDQLQTIMFLQLVTAGHLLIFICRHKTWFWLKPWPSIQLVTAIILTQIAAVFICKYGWFVTEISWSMILYVWLYAIVWMFILNVVSYFFQHHNNHRLKSYNKSDLMGKL